MHHPEILYILSDDDFETPEVLQFFVSYAFDVQLAVHGCDI